MEAYVLGCRPSLFVGALIRNSACRFGAAIFLLGLRFARAPGSFAVWRVQIACRPGMSKGSVEMLRESWKCAAFGFFLSLLARGLVLTFIPWFRRGDDAACAASVFDEPTHNTFELASCGLAEMWTNKCSQSEQRNFAGSRSRVCSV